MSGCGRPAAELAAMLIADGGKYPFLPCGGMAQRVAFAAATAAGAPVLMADEPTRGLDPALRDRIVRRLRRVLQSGGALLLVTHDPALACRIAPRRITRG